MLCGGNAGHNGRQVRVLAVDHLYQVGSPGVVARIEAGQEGRTADRSLAVVQGLRLNVHALRMWWKG
eukprot:89337-Prymnesium_polylepis.1